MSQDKIKELTFELEQSRIEKREILLHSQELEEALRKEREDRKKDREKLVKYYNNHFEKYIKHLEDKIAALENKSWKPTDYKTEGRQKR